VQAWAPASALAWVQVWAPESALAWVQAWAAESALAWVQGLVWDNAADAGEDSGDAGGGAKELRGCHGRSPASDAAIIQPTQTRRHQLRM